MVWHYLPLKEHWLFSELPYPNHSGLYSNLERNHCTQYLSSAQNSTAHLLHNLKAFRMLCPILQYNNLHCGQQAVNPPQCHPELFPTNHLCLLLSRYSSLPQLYIHRYEKEQSHFYPTLILQEFCHNRFPLLLLYHQSEHYLSSE